MTIKLGDTVRFVNENMQGTVTSINGNTAGVTIEDDFEIPVLLSELVKINNPQHTPTNATESPVTTKPKFVKVYNGFHIAFEKLNEEWLELKFHNSEADWVMCAVYENSLLTHKFLLEQETNTSLGKYALEKFNQWPEFQFVIHPLYQPFKTVQPTIKKIKFHAKEFHAGFKQCYFLGKQAYTFRLDAEIKSADLEKLKLKDFNEPLSAEPKQLLQLHAKPTQVVDLHIENLIPNAHELTPEEMIKIQMDAVAKTIEMAHVHRMTTLTLIHGVGNHYLKNKIRNYLNSQKQLVMNYKDGDMLKYGGGATEVTLRQ